MQTFCKDSTKSFVFPEEHRKLIGHCGIKSLPLRDTANDEFGGENNNPETKQKDR